MTFRWSTFFSLGFRPFFLAAFMSSTVLLPLWVASLFGGIAFDTSYYGPVVWHAHDMLYGFVLAAVAGFALTASANWTGIQTLHGWPLAILFLTWIAGRMAPFFSPELPPYAIAVLDLSFYPIFILGFLPPILKAKNYRNLVFVPLFSLLFAGNICSHLAALGVLTDTGLGLRIGEYTVVVLISLIAGRVVPFFTGNAIAHARTRKWRGLEVLVIPATVVAGALAVANGQTNRWLGAVYLAVSALHAVRAWGWFDRRVAKIPLLWILYVGYAWVVVGFALLGLAQYELVAANAATHAFTAGAMGTLIFGIMTRVILGHTGRRLTPAKPIVVAYVLLTLATVMRTISPLLALDPTIYLSVSATAWTLAYGIGAIIYVPMLLKPRLDGKTF